MKLTNISVEILEEIRFVIQLDAIFFTQLIVEVDVGVEKLIIFSVFNRICHQNVVNVCCVSNKHPRVEELLTVALNRWILCLQIVVGPAKVFSTEQNFRL